mgnify:CR=1 FL=1
MELVFEYVIRGIADVFTTSNGAFDWMPLVMVVAGLFVGIIVGATPGLNGPFAMALSLPVLIWVFGVSDDALLPILGFLIGLMKGATVGGADGVDVGHVGDRCSRVTPGGESTCHHESDCRDIQRSDRTLHGDLLHKRLPHITAHSDPVDKVARPLSEKNIGRKNIESMDQSGK